MPYFVYFFLAAKQHNRHRHQNTNQFFVLLYIQLVIHTQNVVHSFNKCLRPFTKDDIIATCMTLITKQLYINKYIQYEHYHLHHSYCMAKD